jgi:hypothetical protein
MLRCLDRTSSQMLQSDRPLLNAGSHILTTAQARRQIEHERRSGPAGNFIDRFLADGDAVVDALATAVNRRLFRDEAR